MPPSLFPPRRGVKADRRNEYGFTLGGPAIKNRTFLFGSFFRLSSSAASTDVATVETPQFLQFLQANYPNNISTKLLTAAPPGNYPTTGFISASQLAKSSYYPVPANIPGSLPVVGTAYINQTLARPAQQWNTRLDQYLRQDKDRIFFNYFNFYSRAQADNPRPVQRIVQPNNGMFGKLDWSTTISPAVVNDVSMTLNRVDGRTPQTSQPEFPSIGVTGLNGFSQSNIAWAHVNYNWHDVLSLLRGNHSIKVGTDIDRQHDLDNFSPSYVRPSFSFANVLDMAQDLPISQTGPILQTSNGQLAQNLYKRIHMLYVGAFLQDDWKLRPNFTLNLGIRYDYFGHLAQMDNGGVPTSFFTLGKWSDFCGPDGQRNHAHHGEWICHGGRAMGSYSAHRVRLGCVWQRLLCGARRICHLPGPHWTFPMRQMRTEILLPSDRLLPTSGRDNGSTTLWGVQTGFTFLRLPEWCLRRMPPADLPMYTCA